MKETTLFSKMPRAKILLLKKWNLEFERIIEQIYNEPDEAYFKNIANMVYAKLSSDDKNNFWTPTDYSNFKSMFSNVESTKIDVLGISIQKCLEASNSEIYRELQLVSEQVAWYPIRERVEDKETKQYCSKEKEITVSDCFHVSISFMGYMQQFIYQQSKKYLELFAKNDEEIEDIINKIKEDSIVQELIFTKFDDNFKFITEYPLFEDIYFKIRETLMERVIQCIYFHYSSDRKKVEDEMYSSPNYQGVNKGYNQMEHTKRNRCVKYLVRGVRK